MSDLYTESRASRLDAVLHALLTATPELEAAAVVSFDGLPMASALPAGMDEDRVAAMSAALLSLGERAAQGLGRGELSQVYIEGENGTVFLVSAEDAAVLVAVAARGAKIGMMLFEVKRAAAGVAAVLRPEAVAPSPAAPAYAAPAAPTYAAPTYAAPAAPAHAAPTEPVYAAPVYAPSYAAHDYSVAAVPSPSGPVDSERVWPGYAPALPADPQTWA